MDVRILRYFDAVARLQNITLAAEELHIAQPALSKHLKNLEAEIGVDLLVRHQYGISLTEEGQKFFEYIQPLLDEFNRLEKYIKEKSSCHRPAERVKIGFVDSVKHLIIPVISRMFAQYNEIEWLVHRAHSSELHEMLVKRHLDIAVTRIPIYHELLNYSIFDQDPIGVVLPDTHPWLEKKIKPHLSDLNDKDIVIITSNLLHSGFIHIINVLKANSIRPRRIIQSNSFEVMMELIAQSAQIQRQLIGIAPKSSVSLSRLSLSYVPFENAYISTPLALVWRRGESRELIMDLLEQLNLVFSCKTDVELPEALKSSVG